MKICFWTLFIGATISLSCEGYKEAAVMGVFMIGVAIMYMADKKKEKKED